MSEVLLRADEGEAAERRAAERLKEHADPARLRVDALDVLVLTAAMDEKGTGTPCGTLVTQI